MNAVILVFGSLFPTLFGVSNSPVTATQYIEKYRELAISEMHRTNIPASIKMAQGILESGLGTSTLAIQANNHFGIKCGSSWTGDTYFREDDDYRNGKLIKSCFRKFDSAAQSYIAHSEFLMSQPRYSSLFNLSPLDYKGWAHGLRAAGYATDKAYPAKLIEIIKKYNLDDLDHGQLIAAEQKSVNKEVDRNSNSSSDRNKTEKSESSAKDNSRKSYYTTSEMNKTKIVVSNGELSLRQIARDHKIDLDDIKKYNEDLKLRSTSQKIPEGEVVFLEKRKKGYFGSSKHHVVKNGDTMQSIARKYGVNLEFLYIKNRMPLDSQPLVGEKIFLKGIVRLNNAPEFRKRGERKRTKKDVLF